MNSNLDFLVVGASLALIMAVFINYTQRSAERQPNEFVLDEDAIRFDDDQER